MWKVLVVICTLGNPCTMFEQEPGIRYDTEKERVLQAEITARAMVETYIEYGYQI